MALRGDVCSGGIGEGARFIIHFTNAINTTQELESCVGEDVKLSQPSPSPLSKEELRVMVVVMLMGVENLENLTIKPHHCHHQYDSSW